MLLKITVFHFKLIYWIRVIRTNLAKNELHDSVESAKLIVNEHLLVIAVVIFCFIV